MLLLPLENAAEHGTGEDQRRRLAERSRQGQDRSGEEPGRGRGEHEQAGDLPARGADAVAGLAEGSGTARIASADVMMTIGRTRTASVIPPAIMRAARR